MQDVMLERRGLFRLFHSLLTTRIENGIESGDAIQVANALETQMTLVRQLLMQGRKEVYDGIAESALGNASRALPLLVQESAVLPEGLAMLASQAFHYLVNMIQLRRLDQFTAMLELYVSARQASQPQDSQEQQTLEQHGEEPILLGSLALLYSEFDQQDEPLTSVLRAYQRTLNLDALAGLLEVYLRDWHQTGLWIMRYGEYFRPIQRQMHDLPERYRRVPGAMGMDVVPDHPSSIIQKLASPYSRPAMAQGAYHLYLRICDLIGREADEKLARFHS